MLSTPCVTLVHRNESWTTMDITPYQAKSNVLFRWLNLSYYYFDSYIFFANCYWQHNTYQWPINNAMLTSVDNHTTKFSGTIRDSAASYRHSSVIVRSRVPMVLDLANFGSRQHNYFVYYSLFNYCKSIPLLCR